MDETVDSFEDSIVDAGDEPAEDAVLVLAYSLGDFDDGRKTAVGSPEVPFVEVGFGLVGGLVEEVLEGEANLVGAGGFQMGVGDVEGVELFPLALVEVLGVLEPDVAAFCQFGIGRLLQAADLIDGVVDEADDMEFVESDLGVR